jgi:hypothetical protein
MSREAVGEGQGLPGQAEGAVECPLLLTRWQLAALEAAAHERGLTAGQMLRRLVAEFCASASSPTGPCGYRPPSGPSVQPPGAGHSRPLGRG